MGQGLPRVFLHSPESWAVSDPAGTGRRAAHVGSLLGSSLRTGSLGWMWSDLVGLGLSSEICEGHFISQSLHLPYLQNGEESPAAPG